MLSEEQWVFVGYCTYCGVRLYKLNGEGLLSPGTGGDPDCQHTLWSTMVLGDKDGQVQGSDD